MSVFVSYSTHDKAIVSVIIEAIEAQGLETWVSFRDLRAGSPFDPQIEQALTGASALVVICSKASLASDEVLSEVREALRQNKAVIPVKIEDCVLPPRLNIIQYIIWNGENRGEAIRQLSAALLAAAAMQLENYLQQAGELENVQRLIKVHPEWLPIEYWMRPEYSFVFDVAISGSRLVDVFTARMDSVGARAYLYYLGDYSQKPFLVDGAPVSDLAKLRATACSHALNIRRPLPSGHRLSPANIFESERNKWRAIGPYYKQLTIRVLFGRRTHYEGINAEFREKFVNQFLDTRRTFSPMTVGFELLSYDRIIDGVRSGNRTGAAKYEHPLSTVNDHVTPIFSHQTMTQPK
jgi:hypothetical protein